MCLLSVQIVYYSLDQLTQKGLAKLNFLDKKVSIHVHLVLTPEDLGAILINLIKSQADEGVNHESLQNEANEDHAPWKRNLEDRKMNPWPNGQGNQRDTFWGEVSTLDISN